MLLRQTDSAYVPVSLPIWGRYDGYGFIERAEADAPLRALLRGFDELRQAGRVSVNAPVARLPEQFDAIETLFPLLRRRTLTCDGTVLEHSIIYAPAARAIVAQRLGSEPNLVLKLEPAQTAYRPISDFDDEIRALAYLDAGVRRIACWKPNETGQFSEDEARAFLLAARQTFSAMSEMQGVLSEYEELKFDES